MKNKYSILTIIAAIIICLVVIYLHLLSHNSTKDIFLVQTKKVIIDIKKEFLKDTIDNVFLEIDSLREAKYESYKRNTEVRKRRIEEELYLSEDEFVQFYIDRFDQDINSNLWTAFLWNKSTNSVLYDPSGLYTDSIDSTLDSLKSILSSYIVIEKGNIEGVFGVSKAYIDGTVKAEIEDNIRRRRFSNDSYIWVKEVINYEGGKDYAISRIYPKQPDIEGTYISTDSEDGRGNKPYLEELEGVKEKGELFVNYYLSDPDSSQISEKIAYARLYKDYDWIIAMGVDLADIDNYAGDINEDILSLTSESVIRLLSYILLVLLCGFMLIYSIDRRRLSNSTKSLEKEMNMDVLTNASSRRYGIQLLSSYYKLFNQTKESAAIMMFDIDDFKYINDRFGHNVGDLVLKETVSTIKGFIRSYDQIIRWGGDEFICIFPGLNKEHAIGYGNKLLERISLLEIPVMDSKINVTVSLGISFFTAEDRDYNDVLKRVDEALYKSKKNGKNSVTMLE